MADANTKLEVVDYVESYKDTLSVTTERCLLLLLFFTLRLKPDNTHVRFNKVWMQDLMSDDEGQVPERSRLSITWEQTGVADFPTVVFAV